MLAVSSALSVVWGSASAFLCVRWSFLCPSALLCPQVVMARRQTGSSAVAHSVSSHFYGRPGHLAGSLAGLLTRGCAVAG